MYTIETADDIHTLENSQRNVRNHDNEDEATCLEMTDDTQHKAGGQAWLHLHMATPGTPGGPGRWGYAGTAICDRLDLPPSRSSHACV